MTTQRTPGPWEVQDDTDVIDRRGYFVATAHDPSSDVGTLEEYANARLIAAAPALLEALQTLLQAAHDREFVPGFASAGNYVRAVDQARAAIAAATT